MNKLQKIIAFPYVRLRKIYWIWRYNNYQKPCILQRVKDTPRKKVLFLLINLGMWKSNKLFELLLEDPRFDPYIVTTFIPGDTADYKKYVQDSIKTYFDKLGFPVLLTYDELTDSTMDIRKLEGDLIFYPQPYHSKLSLLPNNALFGYIPYDFPIQDTKVFHNWLYHNICWKIFAVNDEYKTLEEKYSYTRGKNVSVVGYSNSDYYYDGHKVSFDAWKIKDQNVKRVIWAPHHSILSDDTMDQSTFLELADSFLKFAHKHSDKYQFVFKPHPRLKDKLCQLPDWGKKRTDDYYHAWENGYNTNFVEGNYIDLFLSSDAMVHDCCSFIAEYLYTEHPVLFLLKNGANYNLQGKDCDIFDSQYKGHTMSDIESFLCDVVDNRNDPMKERREQIVQNYLRNSDDVPVSVKIYNELLELTNDK